MEAPLKAPVSRLVRFDPSPPLVIETRFFGTRRVRVVRDDLLPGGTKQRGLYEYLRGLRDDGVRHVVYASPFCGFAQVAVAFLAPRLGLGCTLLCERDPETGKLSRYSEDARSHGATIVAAASLADANAAAPAVAGSILGARVLPLGFGCPEFRRHYVRALRERWPEVTNAVPSGPRTLWVTVGSGTLIRCFGDVLVDSPTRIRGVDVHVLGSTDPRIVQLTGDPRLELCSAPIPFCSRAERTTSFPSNPFYDAKVAPFLEREACDGDVFWNVAG